MLATLAPRPPRTRLPGLLIAAALHAGLLAWVLGHQPPSLAQSGDAPIMVSFIAPPAPEPAPEPAPTPPQPRVEPVPPKPKVQPKPKPKATPEVRRPKEPKTVIASRNEEPASFVAPAEPAPELKPAPASKPEPAQEALEPTPPAATQPPATAATPATAPAAPPISPPRYDAAYLRNPKPPYPGLSRRLQEEGTVVLRVYVSPEGTPERVELNRSSGYARLDQSALETIRRHWRFNPARQGNTPVGGWVLVPIAFTLQG